MQNLFKFGNFFRSDYHTDVESVVTVSSLVEPKNATKVARAAKKPPEEPSKAFNLTLYRSSRAPAPEWKHIRLAKRAIHPIVRFEYMYVLLR